MHTHSNCRSFIKHYFFYKYENIFRSLFPQLALYLFHLFISKSSTPNNAYLRQWCKPPLVQIMACCLWDAKTISGPMLTYCRLDTWEIPEIWINPAVCKISAILSLPQCVNAPSLQYNIIMFIARWWYGHLTRRWVSLLSLLQNNRNLICTSEHWLSILP